MNQTGRMTATREALRITPLLEDAYNAALAEVEEWEAEVQRLGDDVAEQALRIIDLGQKENEAVARAEAADAKNAELSKLIVEQEADYRERKKAAEAEADRLKTALEQIAENTVRATYAVEVARAALAPADRNTTL